MPAAKRLPASAPAAWLQTAGGRPGDPDEEAREAVAAELQKWAQEEAQRREAGKRQALAYATGKRCLGARRMGQRFRELARTAAVPGMGQQGRLCLHRTWAECSMHPACRLGASSASPSARSLFSWPSPTVV